MPAHTVYYVDVDDTLVRHMGTTRVPISETVAYVRRLYAEGAELYCWSRGGAEYCRQIAAELGLSDCFTAYMAKPDAMIDDQRLEDWPRIRQIHPNQL